MANKKNQRVEIEKIVSVYEDISPENVSYLIQNSDGRYIVFLDADHDLDWETTDNFDISNTREISKMIADICVLQHNACVRQMNRRMKEQFNCLLGGALVANFEENYTSGEKLLKEAKKYLQSREFEITRRWFVQYCLSCFVVIAVVYALANTFVSDDSVWVASMPAIRCLFFGAVGGIWSVLQHNGKQNYTCSAGRMLVFMEVISRMVISMVSAILLWKAYQAGFIFSNFSVGDGRNAFEVCLYIVAGFSERLAPSLVEKFEGSKEEENEKESIDSVKSGA